MQRREGDRSCSCEWHQRRPAVAAKRQASSSKLHHHPWPLLRARLARRRGQQQQQRLNPRGTAPLLGQRVLGALRRGEAAWGPARVGARRRRRRGRRRPNPSAVHRALEVDALVPEGESRARPRRRGDPQGRVRPVREGGHEGQDVLCRVPRRGRGRPPSDDPDLAPEKDERGRPRGPALPLRPEAAQAPQRGRGQAGRPAPSPGAPRPGARRRLSRRAEAREGARAAERQPLVRQERPPRRRGLPLLRLRRLRLLLPRRPPRRDSTTTSTTTSTPSSAGPSGSRSSPPPRSPRCAPRAAGPASSTATAGSSTGARGRSAPTEGTSGW